MIQKKDQSVIVDPSIGPAFAPYIKPDMTLDAHKLFEDFLKAVHAILPLLELPPGMTALTTEYNPCLLCMKKGTEWEEPQALRCRHGCKAHDAADDCADYTRPSLTHSKIGAVLVVCWQIEDESSWYLDIDINCPGIPTTTKYDGRLNDAMEFLIRTKPRGGLEELRKMENVTGAEGNTQHIGANTWSVACRLINRKTVLTRQVSSRQAGAGHWAHSSEIPLYGGRHTARHQEADICSAEDHQVPHTEEAQALHQQEGIQLQPEVRRGFCPEELGPRGGGVGSRHSCRPPP
jgi:hypothetical protein